MQAPDRVSTNGGPDLAEWERVSTAYWALVTGREPAPGANQRIEDARARAAGPTGPSTTAVDLYVDPVCPYTWLVACWLREVARRRDVVVRHHVMSLHLLNAGGVLEDRYRSVVGPSRVATAVLMRHGPGAMRAWHEAFGARTFDCWRHPTPQELRAAALHGLVAVGLPTELVDAAEGDEFDDELVRSTEEAILPVGHDVGTPIIRIDGSAFFGPILNAVPVGDAALRLFDGLRWVVGSPDFFELKRTRTSPPDLRYRPDDEHRDEGHGDDERGDDERGREES